MNVYSEIVEKMGGDPQKDLTEQECLAELRSLSERDFLCGAFWAIENLSDNEQFLTRLSVTKNRASFLRLLKAYVQTFKTYYYNGPY